MSAAPPRTPPRKLIHGVDTPYSPGMIPISEPKYLLPPSSPPNTSSPYAPGTTAYMDAEWARMEIAEALQDLAKLVPASIMAHHVEVGEAKSQTKSIAAAAAEYIKVLLAEREEMGKEKEAAQKRLLGLVFGEQAAEASAAHGK